MKASDVVVTDKVRECMAALIEAGREATATFAKPANVENAKRLRRAFEDLGRAKDALAEIVIDANPANQPPTQAERTTHGYEPADKTYEKLRRRVVANAGHHSTERKPRWAHVMDATGHGSTVSTFMCRDAGFDPDEIVGTEPEREEEDEDDDLDEDEDA